jgi:hypothetical protein
LADPDLVLKLEIEGLRPLDYPDVPDTVEEFRERFFQLILADQSRAAPESVDPDGFPAGSPERAFLTILSRRLEGATGQESEDILEAMRVGLSLLEHGGEKCGS